MSDGNPKLNGYEITKLLGTALQGNVYLGKSVLNGKNVVIKVASKKLYKQGITIINSNKIIRIKENIIKEAKIMKYLSKKSPPKGIILYVLIHLNLQSNIVR